MDQTIKQTGSPLDCLFCAFAVDFFAYMVEFWQFFVDSKGKPMYTYSVFA
jgi:hypothetical protein